ncbi:succinate-semialdehyde dehydrogenase [Leptospira kmetyi]|uniref:Aldehyde dehydrogenase n=1 Tax=Leptospira kmetyi TaxID=408139 RepID=A0A2M9XKT6_9LEPT|nr:aldehyde dehydrogenase family protein [Leptospira kmetyi]AYV57918.1 aldehyde dehydrogenase family protein [Leptospira kmetyi]EQA55715.1 aldehyde dehydrogenase (NAD) family protein [Leptospira kmetyi serovar Malaysia str. Bejo-Iso9]PJZ39909.1 succinate-semialdehyde dehydrogenase [Leptospira kmetyi]TGL72770.1 aldehyde dehydrogenase family protein [Leptospira kmetyi]
MAPSAVAESKRQTNGNYTGSGFQVAQNPATLEEIGKVPNTDLAKMPEIFKKAREAQKEWSQRKFSVRKKHLLKMRDYIVDHAEELAEIVSKDNGKSRMDALATEVLPAALAADWYAKNARHHLQPKKLPMSTFLFFNKKNELHRVPLGVVGIISPWNYPLSIPFGEIAMGLMAGNAILLKVAQATILVGQAIEKIVAAGELPEGLFYHIVGSGGAVSKSFFENKIDKIFFTGSVATGKTLMAAAASTLTPLSLELGGKDPMIVLDDADLERAANGAAWAGYQNAGQSCGGVERVYVQEKVYDKFVNLLAAKTKAIRHGADQNFEVDMGSMTTEEQLNTVKRQVDGAVKQGAKIIAQSQPTGNTKGFFYPATLMVDVNHQMELMQEENFGPVIPVMKFKTIEEAIALANDSSMALTSSVWTKNLNLGKKIARKLESGATTINDHLYTHGQSETPWGGWKESGLGRTHSGLGFDEMTQPKLVNWDIIPSKRNIWWYPFNKTSYEAILAAMRFNFTKNPISLIVNGTKLTVFMIGKMFTSWKV